MKCFQSILLTALALIMLSCNSSFKRDGIRYRFHNDGLAVVSKRIGEYVGDIVIPDTVLYRGVRYAVVRIDESAFENCGRLQSVVIPGTVKSIGERAMAHCTALKAIHCRVDSPIEISSAVFEGVDKAHCALYVPLQMAQSYSSSPSWNQFVLFEEGEVVETRDIPVSHSLVKSDDHGE